MVETCYIKSMKQFFVAIGAACLSLILAALLVPNFSISGDLKQGVQTLLLAGVILGLINFFIRPLINIVTWPLKMLTFGLFSLVVNMAIIWLIDLIFQEITIKGFLALFLTGILSWLTHFLTPKKDN